MNEQILFLPFPIFRLYILYENVYFLWTSRGEIGEIKLSVNITHWFYSMQLSVQYIFLI